MKSPKGFLRSALYLSCSPKGRIERLSRSKGVEGGDTAFYLKKLHDKNQKQYEGIFFKCLSLRMEQGKWVF